jgi:outer membrane receptor protein involved in Fe transport
MTAFRRSVAVLLSCASSAALAQQTAEVASDEIVVTAQKREQKLQDVPIAVSAFSADTIANRVIDDAQDLQFSIPNLVFNGASATLRGIGNSAISSTAEGGLGYHVNGVYLNAPRALESEYFDVERIEVLRGPQGTLYGRNTTAGVINIITRKPTDTLEGFLSGTYGNYDTVKLKGAVNIPLGVWQQRIAGYYLKRDGYNLNLFNGNRTDGRDSYAVRSSTRVEFGERTTADLVVSYFKEDSNRATLTKGVCTKDAVTGCSPLSIGFEAPDSRTTIFQRLPTSGLLFFPGDWFAGALNPSDLRTVNEDMDPTFKSSETFVSFELNHEFDAATLTLLTGYARTKTDIFGDFDRFVPTVRMRRAVTYRPNARDVVTTDLIQSGRRDKGGSEQWSQELRLASTNDGAFNWLAGAFVYDAESEIVVDITHPALAFTQQIANQPIAFETFRIESTPSKTKSWALFGETYFDLSELTRLTVGARYSRDRKSILTRQLFLDPLPGGVIRPFTSARDKWGVFTGRVVLDHRFSDDVLGYASFARGYKAGGLNPGGPAGGQSFDPEYLYAGEAGLKSTLADGRLTANLSSFYYDYKGLQLGQVAETSAITVNADARIWGLEAEFGYRPVDAFQLDLAASYLNTRIKNFASGDEGDPNAIAPGSVPARDAAGAIRRTSGGVVIKNLSGNELPNSPEFKVNVGAQYSVEFAGGWSLTPRVDYVWQTGYEGTVFNKPSDHLGSWSQTDLKAVLAAPGGMWQLRAFAKNVFDSEDITRISQDGPLVGRFRAVYALEPRTYGLELEVKF